jgi:hydroxymethylglutaryl-CoA reductase
MTPEQLRDGIVAANDLAIVDTYRAATHNKGIMNGIDAVAIATGNDWRAIEAGAHTYAARDGASRSLTEWRVKADGSLYGELTVPLKVGIVGGSLQMNPSAGIGLCIAGVESAAELAELMCATGLAQNFAALRALVSSGIQKGHMKLHARSVATVAGATPQNFDRVVERLIESGEIKGWKATEIIAELEPIGDVADANTGSASGKVILIGEHAVVHGKHALALPISHALQATCSASKSQGQLRIPAWRIQQNTDSNSGAASIATLILRHFDAVGANIDINVQARIPLGVGLGSSAALAVALIRALAKYLNVSMTDAEVNALAFDCEKLSHGTPSGIDNSLAVYDQPLLFCKNNSPPVQELVLAEPVPMVIGISGLRGSTREQVAAVNSRRERAPALYDSLFSEIDSLALQARDALLATDYENLGIQMNICHGLLNSLGVSTPELEHMVVVARQSGAVGAKLTGAGGGGSVIALCPDAVSQVETALRSAGYQTLALHGS